MGLLHTGRTLSFSVPRPKRATDQLPNSYLYAMSFRRCQGLRMGKNTHGSYSDSVAEISNQVLLLAGTFTGTSIE